MVDVKIKPDSYADIPYPSITFAQTHPDHLATLAKLNGLDPPPVNRSRVLELGCASGENIIPFSLEFPEADLVGLDLSSKQIKAAQAAASALGAKNLKLLVADIACLPEDLGEFDYIIAHGVYSWIPQTVRASLLEACKSHLSPNGIAYISFNSYPGWRFRQSIREMLQFHVAGANENRERADHGLELLEFLARGASDRAPGYRIQLQQVLEGLGEEQYRAGRLFHDLLEENSEAIWISEFCEDLSRTGLQYLCDTDPAQELIHRFSEEVTQEIDKLSRNVGEREQHLDFLTGRTFRRSLICHDHLKPKRAWDRDSAIDMHVSANVTPCEQPVDDQDPLKMKFQDDHGNTFSTNDPILKAALLTLGEQWPCSLVFSELYSRAVTRTANTREIQFRDRREYLEDQQQLSDFLLRLFARGMIELHLHPPRLCSKLSRCPMASPWARWQANSETMVSNLRHSVVQMDALNRHFLRLMDGTRTHSQLATDLASLAIRENVPVAVNEEPITKPEEIRHVINDTINDRLKKALRHSLLCD